VLTVLPTFRCSVFLPWARVCPARTALQTRIRRGSTPSTCPATLICLCFWDWGRADFQRFSVFPLSVYRRFAYRRFVYRPAPGYCLSPVHALRFHTRSLCALCQRLERTGEFTASRSRSLSGCLVPESPAQSKRRTKTEGPTSMWRNFPSLALFHG